MHDELRMAKSDVFFGGEHNERLTCVSQDEYVLRYLEELDPADYPEVLEVFEFHRAQVPSTALRHHEPLELMLEYLDEEYGEPRGRGARSSPRSV